MVFDLQTNVIPITPLGYFNLLHVWYSYDMKISHVLSLHYLVYPGKIYASSLHSPLSDFCWLGSISFSLFQKLINNAIGLAPIVKPTATGDSNHGPMNFKPACYQLHHRDIFSISSFSIQRKWNRSPYKISKFHCRAMTLLPPLLAPIIFI